MSDQQSMTSSDYIDQYLGATITDNSEAANFDYSGAQRTPNPDPTPPNADTETPSSSSREYISTHGGDITVASDTEEGTAGAPGDDPAAQDYEEPPELDGNIEESEHALQASILNLPLTAGGSEASTQHETPVGGVPQATSTQDHQVSEALQTSASSIELSWVPFYLSQTFFLGNAVVFACMIAALEVLYYFSEQHQGLATVSQNKHYLWTYGPLSLLTIISAFWGQMEYRARQLTAWYLMSRGKAAGGLLINYLTTSMPSSLFRSIRNRHSLVGLGICGSLLLRLLIIFSTGFLTLEQRSISRQTDMFIKDSFDFDTCRDSGFQSPSPQTLTGNVEFWAISHYNLSRPYEIVSGVAAQSFFPSDNGVYDTMRADVQVFEAKLTNCQTFEFTFNDSVLDQERPKFKNFLPKQYIEMWEPWCMDLLDTSSPTTNKSLIDVYAEVTLPNIVVVKNCSRQKFTGEDDRRIFVALESGLDEYQTLLSGLWCEPKYHLTRKTVTNASSTAGEGYQIHISPNVQEELDLGVSESVITAYIFSRLGITQNSWYSTGEDPWLTLLNQSEPQSDLSDFRNTSLVEELSKRVWSQFSAFYVGKECKSQSNEYQTLPGVAISTESRLLVQTLSLRLMEIHLGLLILSSIILSIVFSPISYLYRDPGPVGVHAILLARRPPLMDLLSGCGALPEKMLKTRFLSHQSSLDRSIEPNCQQTHDISVTSQDSIAEVPRFEANKDHSSWWYPIESTWWYRVSIVLAAIAIATALQVLSYTSRKDHGLANVDTEGYQKYTWTYIPTLTVAALGLAYSTADSTARVLHPFQLLRKGNANVRDIIYDPSNRISFITVLQAASNRHFALSIIILTGLLAPMLTIATSGLYTPVTIPWIRNVSLHAKDWFNIDDMRITRPSAYWYENEEFAVFNMMQFSNMTYPTWTYDQYAFPTIQGEELRSYNGNDTALSLQARIPALRGNLNCSLAKFYTRKNISMLDLQEDSLKIEPPTGCNTPHDHLVMSPRVYQSELGSAPKNDYEILYLDAPMDVATATGGICGDNRNHSWYMAASSRNHAWEDITLIHCVPYIEALFVNVSFSLPTFKIMSFPPVTPEEVSGIPFSNASFSGTIERIFFEDFTTALANGTHGAPLSQLTGIQNSGKFIDRIDHLHRILVAQALHFHCRYPADAQLPANTTNDPAATHFADDEYFGLVIDGTRLRLIQDEVSTRILQGLLITMALCVVVSCILEPHTKILPKDPGSIASKMSLFADGEVWKNIPEGAEKWSDEEIKQRGLLQGVVLKMGWWGGEGEGEEEEGGGGGRRWFGVDAVRTEGPARLKGVRERKF